jgi:hypothetical protein
MNVAKKNSKNAAICARNYANREKDVYDTLHVKGLKEVKSGRRGRVGLGDTGLMYFI